jgi:hypothetical protein
MTMEIILNFVPVLCLWRWDIRCWIVEMSVARWARRVGSKEVGVKDR